jgi:hypothetical protein
MGLATLAVLGAGAMAPGAASAAQTFGANLTQEPSNGCASPCTLHTWIRSDSTLESGSPAAGVLTKIRFKYLGDGGSGRFIVLRSTGASNFHHVGPEMPFTVPATGSSQQFSFDVRRAIAVGDRIGVVASSTLTGLTPGFTTPTDRYEATGDPRRVYIAVNNHPPDTTLAYQDGGPFELLVNATVEPDADADGFGDESQDQCPGAAGPENGCVPAPPPPSPPTQAQPAPPPLSDTAAPAVSGLTVSRRVFAVSARPTPLVAVARGTTFRYTLSEAGIARFTFQRARPGRRSGRRCVRPTQRLSRARRCTRFVGVGTLLRSSLAGPNRLVFTGRIGRRALPPGSYRLLLRATDSAGNRSATKSVTFRIVRP